MVTDVEMEWAELWAGDVHGSVREGIPSMVAHTVLKARERIDAIGNKRGKK